MCLLCLLACLPACCLRRLSTHQRNKALWDSGIHELRAVPHELVPHLHHGPHYFQGQEDQGVEETGRVCTGAHGRGLPHACADGCKVSGEPT